MNLIRYQQGSAEIVDSTITHTYLQRMAVICTESTNFIVGKCVRLRFLSVACLVLRLSRSLALTAVRKSMYDFLYSVNSSAGMLGPKTN
jgi:hypothetical protein